jgi:hypothetical protein
MMTIGENLLPLIKPSTEPVAVLDDPRALAAPSGITF